MSNDTSDYDFILNVLNSRVPDINNSCITNNVIAELLSDKNNLDAFEILDEKFCEHAYFLKMLVIANRQLKGDDVSLLKEELLKSDVVQDYQYLTTIFSHIVRSNRSALKKLAISEPLGIIADSLSNGESRKRFNNFIEDIEEYLTLLYNSSDNQLKTEAKEMYNVYSNYVKPAIPLYIKMSEHFEEISVKLNMTYRQNVSKNIAEQNKEQDLKTN